MWTRGALHVSLAGQRVQIENNDDGRKSQNGKMLERIARWQMHVPGRALVGVPPNSDTVRLRLRGLAVAVVTTSAHGAGATFSLFQSPSKRLRLVRARLQDGVRSGVGRWSQLDVDVEADEMGDVETGASGAWGRLPRTLVRVDLRVCMWRWWVVDGGGC